MKFGYVNLAVHNWNDELLVFILEENPTNLCPNKCYINCSMKIKRILYVLYVSMVMLTLTPKIFRTKTHFQGSQIFSKFLLDKR